LVSLSVGSWASYQESVFVHWLLNEFIVDEQYLASLLQSNIVVCWCSWH